MKQTIINKSDFVLAPTDKSEIKYLWNLLSQWEFGGTWRSMYSCFEEFKIEMLERFQSPIDAVWTCWTKNGKASKKFGVILLSEIAYGLSVEIHGVADKEFYKKELAKKKNPLTDKAFKEVLRYSFEDLGCARVNATFYKRDEKLLAFLRRHRFTRNAVLKKAVYVDGNIHDKFIYGMTEDTYFKEAQNVQTK